MVGVNMLQLSRVKTIVAYPGYPGKTFSTLFLTAKFVAHHLRLVVFYHALLDCHRTHPFFSQPNLLFVTIGHIN